MGGEGSGRKESFKTKLVLFGVDVQSSVIAMLDEIKNHNATFDEIETKLIDLGRKARRVCEENERL
ncbi:MAG: hypothetical protein WCY09_07420 [Candidatus Omnitrophota bacterium]